MTSMYDDPPLERNAAAAIAEDAAARWPGADRRRAQQGAATYPARRDDTPAALTAAGRAAVAHDVGQLDATDLERFHALCERAGVDPAAVGRRVHLARTRRGIIIVLSVYSLDPAGQPAIVYGAPVVSHYVRPVTVAELPVAWLREGDR